MMAVMQRWWVCQAGRAWVVLLEWHWDHLSRVILITTSPGWSRLALAELFLCLTPVCEARACRLLQVIMKVQRLKIKLNPAEIISQHGHLTSGCERDLLGTCFWCSLMNSREWWLIAHISLGINNFQIHKLSWWCMGQKAFIFLLFFQEKHHIFHTSNQGRSCTKNYLVI